MSNSSLQFWCVAVGLVLTASIPVTAQAPGNNTPPFVRTAQKIGPADPSETIEVTVWLKVHNRQQLDAAAEELYNPNSPRYRAWLSSSQIVADYAPTAQEANVVKEFLSAHNLSVVLTDPNNFFVQARGTIGQISAAFHVQMSNFKVRGEILRANTNDPLIEGPAAALVHHVSGLSNSHSENLAIQKYTPPRPSSASPSSSAQATPPLTSVFSSNCFHAPVTETFTTSGALPSATYTGNLYDSTTTGGCGYTPPEIYTAYNLNALYNEGHRGRGQTIVIFEQCGSPTIQADTNAFSAQFGLPLLTSSNFRVIDYPTPSFCDSPNVEENIDVEWAHAIAPTANIVVLVTPGNLSFPQAIDLALLDAIVNHLGNVMSFSYGEPEIFVSAADLDETNLIIELAAASGIAANFSSGDDGDYTPFGLPPTVLYPASSPYATAVGGISLALNGSNAIKWQAGWGNNINLLYDFGFVSDPPFGFFYAGSGGGSSSIFAKPGFQSSLPGSFRLLPDISWLADPFTGVAIAITEPFVYPPLEWVVYGGTSVACPMFSGLWAIANQEAGVALGQAAPYVYSMPASTITDIVPVGSSTNVTGSITDFFGTTFYSADQLAQPLYSTTVYYDALWNVPLNPVVELVTFGTDSGLTTAPGWDNVTGMGVPKPKAFADFFRP